MQQCKVIYFLKFFLNLLLPVLFQYFLLRKNHTYMQYNCLYLKKSYSILWNDATSIFNQLQVGKKQEKMRNQKNKQYYHMG